MTQMFNLFTDLKWSALDSPIYFVNFIFTWDHDYLNGYIFPYRIYFINYHPVCTFTSSSGKKSYSLYDERLYIRKVVHNTKIGPRFIILVNSVSFFNLYTSDIHNISNNKYEIIKYTDDFRVLLTCLEKLDVLHSFRNGAVIIHLTMGIISLMLLWNFKIFFFLPGPVNFCPFRQHYYAAT